MSSPAPSDSPSTAADDPAVAGLIAAQRRELAARRRWLWATRLASLAFAAWYLVLIIVLGRDSPFYLLVSVFAVITGLSAIVVVYYFDPPLLLRNLHDSSTATSGNWRALHALRGELLEPFAQDLGVAQGPARDALLADPAELVRRTAPALAHDRRRFGKIYLGVYLVVAAAFIAGVCTYTPAP